MVHTVAMAIDRPQLFDRVARRPGQLLTTLGVSPDPVWTPEIPADQQLNFDPDRAKQSLDDAGYNDTDGDGVREMPDGGQALKFRYGLPHRQRPGRPIRDAVTGG